MSYSYLEQIQNKIKAAWQDSDPTVKWHQLELIQRDIIRTWRNNRVHSDDAIDLLDEALAAFTKRGRSF